MENDGPAVGLDAPTAKSKLIKLDNRDRRLESANLRFGAITIHEDDRKC
jgi:hypothetical protein